MSGFDNWQYRIYYAALQSGQDHNDIKTSMHLDKSGKQAAGPQILTSGRTDALLTSATSC